jgi:quinol monooxygenase YgiN
MTYVRMFNSAVDPSEVDEIRKAFLEELQPLFATIDGCISVELLVSTEHNAGGLVDGCILARWTSPEAIERAYQDDAVRSVATRIRGLLRQEPVVRLFEVIE